MARVKTTTKETKDTQDKKFIFAIGRRKSAVASVRLFDGEGASYLNGKLVEKILLPESLDDILQLFDKLGLKGKMHFTAKTNGGGVVGMTGAVRLGVARALAVFNPNYKKELKDNKFLTRDPREVERKKVGLKKARKGPSFSKR